MVYEKPTIVVLGEASELILGGGKYGKDCCDCYHSGADDN